MNKLIYILWIIVGVLLVIFGQIKLFSIFPFINKSFAQALNYTGNAIILGLWLGLLFGAVSCPVCGIPFIFYTAGAEQGKAKNIILAGLIFNISRFIVFLILGILAGILGELIIQAKLNKIFPFITMLVGIFLVILALDLFNIININFRINLPKLNIQHPGEYIIWGMILGIICATEGLAFAAPVWLNALTKASILYAMLAMVVFTIASFIPPIAMLGIFGSTIELLSKRINILKPIKHIGGFVLLFLATQYIILGIINLS